MRKHALSTAEDLVSIRVPKKLAGKRWRLSMLPSMPL